MKLRRNIKTNIGYLIAESSDDVEALQRLFKIKQIREAYSLWIRDPNHPPATDELINLVKAFPNVLAIISISNFEEE